MPIAARSLTLPPGFRFSSLAKMSAAPPGTIRPRRSMGVSPTSSVMFSATRSWVISQTFQSTGEVTGASNDERSEDRAIWPSHHRAVEKSTDPTLILHLSHRILRGLPGGSAVDLPALELVFRWSDGPITRSLQ